MNITSAVATAMSALSISGGQPALQQVDVSRIPSDVLMFQHTRSGTVHILQRKVNECAMQGHNAVKVRRNKVVTCARYDDSGTMVVAWPDERAMYNVNDFQPGPLWRKLEKEDPQ